MNKVIVRIVGGIGNQLFCYAAARRLAFVNNVELVIDDVSGFSRDYKYKRHYQLGHFSLTARKASSQERFMPLGRLRRWFMRATSKRKQFAKRSYLKEETIDFDPRLLDLKVSGAIYLEGYWQSENYFKDIEPIIRDDLCITAPVDSQNQEMLETITSRNSVAIHVRWFNAPGSRENASNLADEYYRSAIELIETRVPNAHYYLFSDNPEAAQQRIGLPCDRCTPVLHNRGDEKAYADLWLMSKCKYFIIANSSFSWWGAWLSSYGEKIVVSPNINISEGESSWGFPGLIPEGWIKL